MKPLVLIPCGGRKADGPRVARYLYTGSQFKCGLEAAEALTDHILILSALHGLVGLDQLLEPYDLKMGQRGSVTSAQVTRQAAGRGLLDASGGVNVVLLLPKAYAQVALDVWPRAIWAFDYPGLGMGRQRQLLSLIAREGRLMPPPGYAEGRAAGAAVDLGPAGGLNPGAV